MIQRDNVNGEVIDIMLNQLGAKEIRTFTSTMHIVSFDLGDGLEVDYVFNITHGNKYFLQRMKPYAMVHGKYASYSEIINYITEDISKFRQAKVINDTNLYLELSTAVEEVKSQTENIFLNHVVSEEDFNSILDGYHSLMEQIELIKKKSEKFRKQ